MRLNGNNVYRVAFVFVLMLVSSSCEAYSSNTELQTAFRVINLISFELIKSVFSRVKMLID